MYTGKEEPCVVRCLALCYVQLILRIHYMKQTKEELEIKVELFTHLLL